MKKFFAILLAFAMTFALSAAVFAAQEVYPIGHSDPTPDPSASDPAFPGTITINNAVIGEEYAVYKVFDATCEEDSTNISYTFLCDTSTSDFYSVLMEDDSPFMLTNINQTDTYQVTIKTTVPDPDNEGETITVDGAYVGKWLR